MSLLNARSLATGVSKSISSTRALWKSPGLGSTASFHSKKSNRTVRIIVREDLPTGKAFKDEVIDVKPGYARNYLVPQKFAVYATRQNFQKYGIKDPRDETPEERLARLEKEAEKDDKHAKPAAILRKYLSNKALTIWRDTDPESENIPADKKGVNAQVVREKLSKQLKIDLEDHEKVHIKLDPVKTMDELTEEDFEKMVEEMPTDKECDTQIRRLGDFLACISLRGNYRVPLKVHVVQR